MGMKHAVIVLNVLNCRSYFAGGYGLYRPSLSPCNPPSLYLLQISVNANIISDSGGPCVCPTKDQCLTDNVYLSCVSNVRRDLITATAAISALSSFFMGLLANLPVGLAPGLGLNAYVRVIYTSSLSAMSPSFQ